MIKEVVGIVSKGKDLTGDQTEEVFLEIMGGEASAADMKAFLIALAEKGESVDEITRAAVVMRDKMTKISLKYEDILDTCGTGGGSSSFNVSTIVSIIAAAAGAKVAKHGNRSYTSHCGSADILEHVGVKIDITPEKAAQCIERIGVGFLFAPLYHSAMKHVIGVRREIKRRTIFNILGPLSNPAKANRQLIGVFDEALTEPMARVLSNLGSKRAFVVRGDDGFDEVSISDETKCSELSDGKVATYKIKPEDFSLARARKEDVACKTLDDNISAFRSILSGEKSPKKDMVLINAAIALIAYGQANSFKEGAAIAREMIDSQKANGVLGSLVKLTNE